PLSPSLQRAMARTKQLPHRRPVTEPRSFKWHLACRMSVSTPSQQRVSQATPHTGPDRPWEYNRGLRIILHDSESCEECLRWIGHFVKSLTKDERSLKTARHALESASDVQKDVDDAQE